MTDTTTQAPATEPVTHHLDLQGATIAWDLRLAATSDRPVLLMVGYPMGATGFTTQAGHFTDRTVVTFDPRGIERSTDQGSAASPALGLVEQHVADLHALVSAIRTKVGDGPIDVFASSGGAVTTLALVARHPDDLATVVAHEPPTLPVLDDFAAAGAAWLAVHDSYERAGWGAGMAHFIAMTSHRGPFDADWASRPGPDPAMFGMPADDDGSRDDPLLSQDDSGVPHHCLDVDAIAASPTQVVVAVGADTGDTLTGRTSAGLAAALGTEVVVFPGGHGGFMGGEYGQVGEPDAFAATLREVLDGTRG